MPLTIPPAVTPAPSPAPQRGDSATFSTRVDALMVWLTNAGEQFNNLATNVYDNAVIAGTSAASAESITNITKWISGTSYTEGNVVWSPTDFLAYRRKITGAGTTDPVTDTTNWAAVTPSTSAEKDASNGYPGLTLFKLNMKNVAGTFTSFFTNTNTAARTYTLPDKDGTVAMISDVPTSFISTSPTEGVGYATGAGGSVTQLSDKSTSVTINKVCGKVTMHSETMAAGATKSFIVYNSTVAPTDIIIIQPTFVISGDYTIHVPFLVTGSFLVELKNVSSSSQSDEFTFTFAVIRTVTA